MVVKEGQHQTHLSGFLTASHIVTIHLIQPFIRLQHHTSLTLRRCRLSHVDNIYYCQQLHSSYHEKICWTPQI